MTEDFTTETLNYLLDELDPERRTAFAAHLARDPVARAAFKNCADGLAQFAADTAPAEALPPAAQRELLTAIMAEISTDVSARVRPARRWRHLWPLAAALLLGLNLLQFWQARPANETEDPDHTESSDPSANANASTERPGTGTKLFQATAPDGKTPAEPAIAAELRRLEFLRKDYAKLQHSREALSAEYDQIIRLLAQRALVEHGVSRLAAMELVDNASFAKGERKGLINLARRFLTEPGIVAIEPVTPPPQTPPAVAPESQTAIASAGTDPTVASINSATSFQGATAMGSTVLPTAPVTTLPPTSEPTSTSSPPAAQTASPYAWSVFDETEHQGYLNLYNLPVVPVDQSLQLWVKPADSSDYQRVGEVPAQFYGGSGSLYYKLPDASATPVEIMVTQEPRKAPPPKPTGAIVLRGP